MSCDDSYEMSSYFLEKIYTEKFCLLTFNFYFQIHLGIIFPILPQIYKSVPCNLPIKSCFLFQNNPKISRSILLDGFRFFGMFWKRTLPHPPSPSSPQSYNKRNMYSLGKFSRHKLTLFFLFFSQNKKL